MRRGGAWRAAGAALVVAGLAAFGCGGGEGGDDRGDGAEPRTTQPAPTFQERAMALCAAHNRALLRIAPPSTPAQARRVETQVAALDRRLQRQLTALRPPADQAVRFRRELRDRARPGRPSRLVDLELDGCDRTGVTDVSGQEHFGSLFTDVCRVSSRRLRADLARERFATPGWARAVATRLEEMIVLAEGSSAPRDATRGLEHAYARSRALAAAARSFAAGGEQASDALTRFGDAALTARASWRVLNIAGCESLVREISDPRVARG